MIACWVCASSAEMKSEMWSSFKVVLGFLGMSGLMLTSAEARNFSYPSMRYETAESQSLGGVTVPLSNEIGNALMNNPAALARNRKFKAEYLNLSLSSNSGMLSNLGLSSLSMTGLGGMSSSLNESPRTVFSAGFGNMTALSWGGLGVGLLFQERMRAVSDGTTVRYQTVSEFVPTVGYGVALARGVVRLGYSVQYVNKASGELSATSDASASFLKGLDQGRGLSHNASVNFVFPFTYIPTFSLMARNLGGLHFVSGSLFSRAQNVAGVPADEKMSLDAAFNMMLRISGSVRMNWYFQYSDFTRQNSIPMIDRLSVGSNFSLSQHFGIQFGISGLQPSAGIGYRSQSSEINLAWYQEKNPFGSAAPANDTRFSLQYKIFFQDRNSRDPEDDLRN